MNELNSLIHQPVRLKIMASLVSLDQGEQVDFTHLRNLLDVTDGNLGAHLTKLQEAGYIKVEKVFISRKPCTFVSATGTGRDAFKQHVKALEDVLKASKP